MQRIIQKYLIEMSADSKDRLTDYFSNEVGEFSLLLSKIIVPLQNYHSEKPQIDTENPSSFAYGIMTKEASTLMAAFELSLNGYFWEPPILLRNAIEGFASAWDIVHNPNRFKIWKVNKKFKSTDSISNIKKEIAPIGEMYGMLSNMYTHIKEMNFAPAFVLAENEPKIQLFGFIGKGKEEIRKGEIYFVLMATYLCLQITESCFHQHSPELETIEIIPGTDKAKTKVSARHRKFVNVAKEHFKKVVDDPSIVF